MTLTSVMILIHPAVGDGLPTRGMPCGHPSFLCWTQIDGGDNTGPFFNPTDDVTIDCQDRILNCSNIAVLCYLT